MAVPQEKRGAAWESNLRYFIGRALEAAIQEDEALLSGRETLPDDDDEPWDDQ
jgi:hypothetical protein